MKRKHKTVAEREAEIRKQPVRYHENGVPRSPVTYTQLFNECTALRQALTEEHEKRLKAAEESQRLLEAGRCIALCLCAASDDSEDGWSPEEIGRLFNDVCKRWPELDPQYQR